VSRSGYSDDLDNWQFIMWRGAVNSSIRGKRGQAFLSEMLAAMDAMPEKRLIANELEDSGELCAIGTVGRSRGVDMSKLDPEDRERVADVFNISPALAAEIVFINDEGGYGTETPEARFDRVRSWITRQIKAASPAQEG
jgi:hypothetical protein